MPLDVEPSPFTPAARFGAPDDAQDASYFAASAICSFFVLAEGSQIARRAKGRLNGCPGHPSGCDAAPCNEAAVWPFSPKPRFADLRLPRFLRFLFRREWLLFIGAV